MSLYMVEYDSQQFHIEAAGFGAAVAAWRTYAATLGDGWDGTEEPEQVVRLNSGHPDDAVIRACVCGSSAGDDNGCPVHGLRRLRMRLDRAQLEIGALREHIGSLEAAFGRLRVKARIFDRIRRLWRIQVPNVIDGPAVLRLTAELIEEWERREDLEAAEVNHDSREVGASAEPAGAAAEGLPVGPDDKPL